MKCILFCFVFFMPNNTGMCIKKVNGVSFDFIFTSNQQLSTACDFFFFIRFQLFQFQGDLRHETLR